MSDRVLLLDGWALCTAPNGPAALHLLTLLKTAPAGKKLYLALPAGPPAWAELGNCETTVHKARLDPGGRLGWMQNTLPGMAKKLKAERLVVCGEEAPLSRAAQTVVFPAGFNLVRPPGAARPYTGLADRLGTSMGWAGLGRAEAVLWPNDLPSPDNLPGKRKVPPFVHPDFHPQAEGIEELRHKHPELPETYVLYHGPADASALDALLDAWRWAAGSLGQNYPLVIAGLAEVELARLQPRTNKRKLADSVHALPVLPPGLLAGLYRGCAAFFSPASCSPWGDPLRHALACGRPAAAWQVPLADRLAGPAAYLTPYLDARALGAALISVVVEESLAERLSLAARERSAAWHEDAARRVMDEI